MIEIRKVTTLGGTTGMEGRGLKAQEVTLGCEQELILS